MLSEKAERILAAARRRFGYFGYPKSTMEEIATEAGIGKTSIYYYFPTKDSLFKAVTEQEQKEFMVRAQAVTVGPAAASDKIREYFEARLDHFHRFLNLSRLSIESYVEFRPLLADLVREFSQWEERTLCALIHEGRRNGEFIAEHPEQVVRVLLRVVRGLRLGALRTSSVMELTDAEYDQLREDTHMVVELFLRGIRAPMQQQT
jgi:AcrR family transcriptional regulator